MNTPPFFNEDTILSLKTTVSPNVAYSLGAEPDGREIVIESDDQILPFPIRHHPRLIHLACDIISLAESKDFWLLGTQYEDLSVMHTQPIDGQCLESRFICKPDSSLKQLKLVKSAKLIESIRFVILDENGRRVTFPERTIVKLGIEISPLYENN